MLIDPRSIVSPEASLGSDCCIAAGAVVSAGVVLGTNVIIGPNVVFVEPDDACGESAALVLDNVRIGANSVIYPSVTVAASAIVRPGTIVNRSIPARAIVEGNPANIVGYVDVERLGVSNTLVRGVSSSLTVEDMPVRGVKIYHFPQITDLRGNLTAGEFQEQIPFLPMRYFMVFGVPSREVRGEHAHYECHQFLICVRGSCSVVADDGSKRIEVILDAHNKGLYLPPMIWGIQYKYSNDALLLVFASHHYDAADYIRDYADFYRLVSTNRLSPE